MQKVIDYFVELKQDLFSPMILSIVFVGFSTGLSLLVGQIAYATLIYSGPMSPYLYYGMGLILFGNIAICLTFALFSRSRGVIAGLPVGVVVAMAFISTQIGESASTPLVTTVFALIISASLVGICCIGLGYLKLANLLRFIPFPVNAGFAFGVGLLLLLAALRLMGVETSFPGFFDALSPSELTKWVPGVLYGVGIVYMIKKSLNMWLITASMLVYVLLYHLVLNFLDISLTHAQEIGLLLPSSTDGLQWSPFGADEFAQIDWSALFLQIPNILVLMLVSLLTIVMYVANFELATREHQDWNSDFKMAGIASVIGGVSSGTIASNIVPASLRSKLLGASSRLTGVVTALTLIAAFIWGDSFLKFIPTSFTAAILVFASYGLLEEGLIRVYRKLPHSELFLILLIAFMMIVSTLLIAVVFGMFIMLILFAIRLSGVDSIDSTSNGLDERSSKLRSIPDQQILGLQSSQIQVLRLTGYIFFGSVTTLSNQLRTIYEDKKQSRCLILEFSGVTGMDYSALDVLSATLKQSNSDSVLTVLCRAPESLKEMLNEELEPLDEKTLVLTDQLDSALEICEDKVIESWLADHASEQKSQTTLLEDSADQLDQTLIRLSRFENIVESLEPWSTSQTFSRGTTVCDVERPFDGIRLLLSGSATGLDNVGNRLTQYSAGDVLNMNSRYYPNLSSIVANSDGELTEINANQLDDLESEQQGLIVHLYRYILDYVA